MNRSKAKGTAAESAVVAYLREHGYPYVERRALGGSLDKGDLAGIPGLVCEIKAHKTMSLSEWVDEAEVERKNDGACVGVVWHKRVRKGSPGDWYVTMTGANFLRLLEDFTRG